MLSRSLLFIFLCFAQILTAQVSTVGLRLENTINPIGIDVPIPRFSWQLSSPQRGVLQSAYEIKMATDIAFKNQVWSSGKVNSDQSNYVAYAGKALESDQRYYWQVRVWDNKGQTSGWSQVAFFQCGLLQSTDWKAVWIKEKKETASPCLRKTFSIGKKIARATLYASAQGLYEMHLNGQRVGDQYLSPGWTAYQKRIAYQAYDLTALLQKGENTLGALLGNGWYLGELGWGDNRNLYGKERALIAQLEILYTDGTRDRIITNESWKTAQSVVQFSEIYDGESVDLRKEAQGWTSNGFDDRTWATAQVHDTNTTKLVANYNEPIRKREQIKPVRIFTTPKGEQVLDFGQNMVGWVKIQTSGAAGQRIIIRHTETLDLKTGNMYYANLRHASSADTFYLAGKGTETLEPRFTFHGFRYIELVGYPSTPNLADFTAIALYSDMPKIGTFECSHPLINQLQSNIQWGQRGNFLDVPTDCPQRDERLGWTGDAQAFSNTALYNFDSHNFFAKWLKDVAFDQGPDGKVPFVVPNVLGADAGGSAGWADVATIMPWNTYVASGDRRILEEQYESMRKWVGFMEANSTNYLWNKGFHFGDWLFYSVKDDNMGRSAVTDRYYIAQCFFAHSTELTLRAAKILDKKDEVTRLTNLLAQVKAAFLQEYITPSGRPVSSTQTALVLALQFDMLPEAKRAYAAQQLVDNIKSYEQHLTTGFLGTPYLCHVLSRFGHEKVAYELLFQETYPSWLYPVKMGATTIWERWDGIKPDSTFQEESMNSFNHYAYGAIGDWMYRNVAGIQSISDAPGYSKFILRPIPTPQLSVAKGTLMCPYGTIVSDWKSTVSTFDWTVEVPANTSATVYIPGREAANMKESGKPIGQVEGLRVLGVEGEYVKVGIGSGRWVFSSLQDFK